MTIKYKDSKRIVGLSSEALVAHLKFNDNVTDSAGSNNGTVTGTTTYVTGKIGKGISLNGSSYVTLANESNFDFEHSDPFSMTFWIKMDSGSDGGTYYVNAKQNSGGGQVGLGLLLLSNGELRFGFDTASGNHRITSSNSVVTESSGWTHVSITYDGSSNLSGCKIYINGSLDVTGSSSSITSTVLNNYAFVWGASSNGSLGTPATYDDTRIYSRELDQSEVSVIYNGGTGTEGDLKPTDVQDNSLLVQKDTARRYWFDADPSYTTVEAGATADSNGGAAYVTYKQITGLTAGDEISHVTFDVYNTPTDTSFKGGVYTDSGNNPTTLLASGELTNQNVSNTYTTLSIPLTSNATVPSDGKVWVAIIPNKTNPLLRVSTSSSSYTNSKYSATTGSYTNYSNWMLSTASVQGAGENNVRFGVKIYHAPAWTMQPTYQTFYDDTKTWTKTGTKTTVNETVSGKVNWNFSSNYTSAENHVETTPLGFTLDNEKWVCDFEFNASAFDNAAENFLVVMQENAGDFISTSGDALACGIYTNKSLRLWKKDSSSHSIYGTGITISLNTDYYARMTRTLATAVKLELFTSEADRTAGTNHVSGSPITYTFSETIQGLDNLTHCGRSDNVGSTRTYNISLDNLKIYNGVTSIN